MVLLQAFVPELASLRQAAIHPSGSSAVACGLQCEVSATIAPRAGGRNASSFRVLVGGGVSATVGVDWARKLVFVVCALFRVFRFRIHQFALLVGLALYSLHLECLLPRDHLFFRPFVFQLLRALCKTSNHNKQAREQCTTQVRNGTRGADAAALLVRRNNNGPASRDSSTAACACVDLSSSRAAFAARSSPS